MKTGITTVAGARRRKGRMSQVERWAPWVALSVMLGLAGAFVLWKTRGTFFWYDEWAWITERRELTAATFLEPHNQHLSLIPVAIYRVLFETFGLSHYWPYRVVLVAGHLTCGLAVFLYARSRVGPVLGVAASALILFFGPGSQNILWPFQIGWLISVAAGIGALLALDRRVRRADVVAAVLLGVSLASSGVGIPFVVAAGVDVGLERRRWRDGLIVAIPLALYAVWWVAYQTSGPAAHLSLVDVPLWVLRAVCASLLGLFGLLRAHFPQTADVPLLLGVPLLIGAAAGAAWRLHRLGRVPPRVIALFAGIITFWVATAIQRGIAAAPSTSRYVYVGSLFVVLLAVEVARGAYIRVRVAGALAAIALVAAAANVPLLGQTAAALRADGENTRIAIGVLEIARENARPREPLTVLPGYPLVVVTAGEYFPAARAWGPLPAAPPAQIAGTTPENARTADRELARIDRASARSVTSRPPRGAPPRVDAFAGGRANRDGACVSFSPVASGSSAPRAAIDLTVPPGGLLVRARGGAATISLRRFSTLFIPEPLATIRARTATLVRIAPDRAPQPWHVRVQPRESATACPA